MLSGTFAPFPCWDLFLLSLHFLCFFFALQAVVLAGFPPEECGMVSVINPNPRLIAPGFV
jgi:hypothetical protein